MNKLRMGRLISIQLFFQLFLIVSAHADSICSKCTSVANTKLYDVEIECCIRSLPTKSNGGILIEVPSPQSFFGKAGLSNGDKLLKLSYLSERDLRNSSSKARELVVEFERNGKVETAKPVVIASAEDVEFNEEENRRRELIRQKFMGAAGRTRQP